VLLCPAIHIPPNKVAPQRSETDGFLRQPYENMEKTGSVTKNAFSLKKPLAAPERFP
jgi:hypothetical protein